MQRFGIGDMELELARLLWEEKEIRSGKVVILCAEKFNWKKSTTYTMLRRLCEHGLFQNVDTIVTPLKSEEEYNADVVQELINDKFEGSYMKLQITYEKYYNERLGKIKGKKE